MLPLLVTVATIFLALWLRSRSQRRSKRLPPGPPGQFLVGNALQVPPFHSWLYHNGLAKQYGDVVHLDVIGQPIISLNSLQAIEDLIVKKSSIFSGRPSLPMGSDLVGLRNSMGLSGPGPRTQMYRKLTHQWLGPPAVARSHTYIENEIHAFMRRYFSSSRTFLQELEFAVGRMMLDTTYGIVPEGPDNQHVECNEEAVIIYGLATQPGKFLVDTFPILKYVPAWVPFAGFQKQASYWRERVWGAINLPFLEVQKEMERGTARNSYVAQALANPPPGATDDMIKWAAGSLYVASVETMSAAIATFILNLIIHPEIQEKGRAEIQRVIGSQRLPTLADRGDLPYLEAILKETLRWHPIVPMSLPYRSTEDYRYRDWDIPKDTILLTNMWSITRNEEIYPSPDEFRPERFMDNASALDPRRYFFGFGRRVCPGQHFADAIMWLTMATLLASTKMSKGVDANGNEIEPSTAYSGGMICGPLPFSYKIEPLSEATQAMFSAS